jgi:hypothetical protein
MRAHQILAVCLLSIIAAAPVFAQNPQDAGADNGTNSLLKRVPDADQGGAFHFTKYLGVSFGGIKNGSGMAAGPAASYTFDNGAFAQLKAEYSIRRFALLQGRFDSPKFWNGRAIVVSRLRWQDAPQLSLRELGPAAPRERAIFGERKTEASGTLHVKRRKTVALKAGFGIEHYTETAGRLVPNDQFPLLDLPQEIGLPTRTWFAHSVAGVTFDQTPGGYSRSGRIVDATLHDYRDVQDQTFSFDGTETGIEQRIPRSPLDGFIVSGRLWTSIANAAHQVPYFLMPTLGGGDHLEAYSLYRFRDRDALWFKGEYRRAVHAMVDVSGFWEIGAVAPSLPALTLSGAPRALGAGVIVHTKTASLLRLDLAHGRDGYGVAVVFTAVQ